jgi:hypothetical protein
LKDGDADTALKLTDDPCIVTGAQGVGRLSGERLAQMMKKRNWQLESFELTDPQVQMLGEDVAVIAYTVHEDLTVEGKPVSLDAAESSTWVRRHGHWRCALHTESLKGDPFGRDKI